MCECVCVCEDHEDPLYVLFQLWNFNIAVCYVIFARGFLCMGEGAVACSWIIEDSFVVLKFI